MLEQNTFPLNSRELDSVGNNIFLRLSPEAGLPILYANNIFFDKMCTEEGSCSMMLIDYIYTEDRKDFEKFTASLNEMQTCIGSFRAITAENTMIWLDVTGLLTEDTIILGMCDISELVLYKSVLDNFYSSIECAALNFSIAENGESIDVMRANKYYYSMSGNELLSEEGKYYLNVYHEDFPILKAKLEEVGNDIVTIDYRATADDGLTYWINMSVKTIGIISGRTIYTALLFDINSMRTSAVNAENEREKYALAMNTSGDIIVEYIPDKNECIVFDMKTSKNKLIENFHETLLEGSLIHPDDLHIMNELFDNTEEEFDTELRILIPGTSDWQWYQLNVKIPEKTSSEKTYIGVLHNINELKAKENRLKEQVSFDSLTKAYTREAGITLIDEYLSNNDASCSYLMVIDLDNFKKVNDTLGHLYGDAILTMATSGIKNCVGERDIVARFGGDEFLLFIRTGTDDGVCLIADAIIRTILELRTDINDTDGISCSIGIVAAKDVDVPRYNSLFPLADKALYKAKYTGKCKFEYYYADDEYYNDFTEIKYAMQKGTAAVSHAKHDIISLAFEILDRSDDLTSALRMLLNHIGSNMQLEKIKIFQVNKATNEVVIAYSWARDINTPVKVGKRGFYEPKDIEEYVKLFNKSTIVQFQPSVIKRFTQKMRDQLEKLNDRAVFYGGVVDERDTFSMIMYQSDDLERVWTDTDLGTLLELTKIVSMYLDKKRALDEAEHRMAEMLNIDALTSTYTFKHFREKISGLFDSRPTTSFAIAYSDFIHFKYVNDLYGFDVGDEILRDFAKAVKESFSNDLHVISRLSNDEFAYITPYTDVDMVISQINDTAAEFCREKNMKYPLANLILRTGIYLIKRGDSANTVIDRANIARKTLAHLTDCDICIFNDDMYRRIMFEAEMARSMRNALANDEFVAYLQPKFDTDTSKIVGAEALVRWIKKDGTLIPPSKFIPYFERNGFVTQIDFCILKQIVKLIDNWQKTNHPIVPISVNLSRLNSRELNLADKIINLVEEYNIPPKYIEFEITETVFGDMDGRFIENIEKLRNYGFLIDIDDFGSGYSTLSMLSEISADIIKIDKSLLTRSLESPKKAKIIIATINMARDLNYGIICEGVETKDEIDFLKSIGCHKVQGYYYAKPMNINDFNNMLESNF